MTGIYTRSIRRRQQRGVILLAIISLLTMFMLIGVTYVVISAHFKRAAITNSQARQLGVPPQKHLDSAMYQLMRDTDHAGSVVRGHSLLQDKYGHFSMRARIVQVTLDPATGSYPADEQILEMQVNLQNLPPALLSLGALNGRVITFLDGVTKNISGRILKSSPLLNNPNANYTLRILFPKSISNTIRPANFGTTITTLLINDRDFSGTGFGLKLINPRYGQLSTEALLPNRSNDTTAEFSRFRFGGANEGYDVPDYQNMAMAAQLSNPTTRQLQYVIPSFHRPALINYWINNRSVPTSPTTNWQQKLQHILLRPMPWDHPNFTGGNSLMSLPAILIDGFPGTAGVDDDNNGITDYTDANRDGIMQATEMDFEELFFPGSIDNFAALTPAIGNFPWDIDNDGDGHPDSVWVDMGFPVQTDSSGRQYKPLFAILCADMDGRLNLNAHGNQMHYLANVTNAPVRLAGPVGTTSAGFPRGSGFGPGEINLAGLFTAPTEYRQLLMAVPNQTPGRYKWEQSPGGTGIDYLSYFIFGHHPRNFSDFRYTSFQSMPDIHGELAHGINRSGNVVFEVSQTPTTGPLSQAPTVAGRRNTIVDTPYELNMVNPQASDQFFTAHELEALVRSQGPDNPRVMSPGPDGRWGTANVDDDNNGIIDDVTEAGYVGTDDVRRRDGASRIYKLVNSFNGDSVLAAANRRSVTSASFDPPVPSVQIPKYLRGQTTYNAGSTFVDLLRARIKLEAPAATQAVVDQRVASLRLPSTLIDGLKMNVNRPFGNGVDDPVPGFARDGVVDNFIEAASPEQLWPAVFGVGNQGVWFDHDNDGIADVADPDAFLARYHYARHLYVLMLLMKDKNRIINFGNGITTEAETHRNIAQWAVNAVDFRDADSIMTPFEFDLNPFNGWGVDGDINTPDNGPQHGERAIVWGTERPELLITESLVYHDRRSENLDTEQPNAGGLAATFDPNNPNDPNKDKDFDQRLLPRSGAFFELYNPWHSPGIDPAGVNNANNPIPGTGSWHPAEFYRGTNGVRLNQTSFYPGVNGIRSPVWRMIVVRGTDRDEDPDHWDPNLRPAAAHVERAIYFSDNPAEILNINGAGNGHEQYYSSRAVAPLLPGRYAVIGSSGDNIINGGNTYQSFIGRSSNATPHGGIGTLDYANTRRFELTPDINPNQGNQVRLQDNINPAGYGDAVDAGTNANAPPIAIVIDSHVVGGVGVPHSLSLTEPIGGYPAVLEPPALWTDGEPQLAPIADTPLDNQYPLDPVHAIAGDPDPRLPRLVEENGTFFDYAVVHLQRLANPLQPYNATTNPYRTIDSHSIDVTAFNGVKDDTDNNLAGIGVYHFDAHQRGDDGVQPRYLWRHDIGGQPLPPPVLPVANATQIFPNTLRTTLGFLNETYDAPLRNGEVDDTLPGSHPFPWLQWNNRPFVSQFELMMVPRSRSSRLLHDYSHFNNINPFRTRNNPAPQLMQYDHLLNFFESGDDQTNFHRLFDYTEVPSHFAGAQTFLNPRKFKNGFGTDEMHPPFNRISNFRDPGRININTIFDPVVYNGLMNGHLGPTYSEWFNSRRGYTPHANTPFDDNFPTFFANPIRPSGSGDIVPLPGLKRSDVDVSLFRSDPNRPTQPLFNSHYTENLNPIPNSGSFNHPTIDDTPRDADRNPSFKYQSLQRLGNLVTGRSNVYGVWITVGYFEVEPAGTPTAARPSGFQLGAEVGIDRGQIKRHRAFFMIDRSIPVAFEPGENHNVDKAVILRRYVD